VREQAGIQGLSLEIWGPAGVEPTGEEAWVPGPGKKKKKANASCLSDSPGSFYL